MFSLAKLYKILGISIFIGLASFVVIPNFASADTYVNGYYRKDGTYVKPHYRSDPDSSVLNNWSTKGNTNPYTGEPGTKDPYSSSPSYNYSLPKSTPYESPTYNYPSYDYSSPSYTAPSYESPSYKYTAPTPYQFNVNNRTKPTPTPYRFNSSYDEDEDTSYYDSYSSDDEYYNYGDYSEEDYFDYYEDELAIEEEDSETVDFIESDIASDNSERDTLSPSVAGAATSTTPTETSNDDSAVVYSMLGLAMVGGGIYAYRKKRNA